MRRYFIIFIAVNIIYVPIQYEPSFIISRRVNYPFRIARRKIGISTSIRDGGGFINPIKALKLAMELNEKGVLQVYLDFQACQIADQIAILSQETGSLLIAHSLLGVRELNRQQLHEEIEIAKELLKFQSEKMVIFHYNPKWDVEEFLEYLQLFNESGLIPCVENPVADKRDYSKFLQGIETAVKRGFRFYLVVDFGKIYTQERGEFAFSEQEGNRVLEDLFQFAEDNKISLILHMMDSQSPIFKDRQYWCPIGEGLIPYKTVIFPLIVEYQSLIKAIILEYEDVKHLVPSNEALKEFLEILE